MDNFNCYDDSQRAEAYARLEFPGTYYLAYRDIPEIINKYVQGKMAIDFGCGTGRSTRFLQKLGFQAVGVDIAEEMIKKAHAVDPDGEYRLINDGDFSRFSAGIFDLILSMFTFDNIPAGEAKIRLFRGLGDLLGPDGVIISVVSSPQIYLHEWASFSTRDYPENRFAKSGDIVKIIITGIGDNRPVEDIVWTDESYQDVYRKSNLEMVGSYKPLADGTEPYQWINETKINPWVIYVLKKRG
ncbi:Methyltransferase [Candidatus Zixiibacteriota bacterium]|nr:Methyltransferase [candidate division Zixibacteria bacterium]